MARARKVLRLGLGIDRRENGDGAVRGTDAGSNTDPRIDRFAESGAVDRCVDGGHEGKVKFVAALLRKCETDEPPAVLGHKVDAFRSDSFGGHGEVAFVSRSSSSTRTIMRPLRISSTASSTLVNGESVSLIAESAKTAPEK